MKLIFLSSILVLSSNWISAQNYYDISFEGTGLYESDSRHELVVEPMGLWQVGSPDKTIFTEAFTLPNAIVTDTANAYPVNANSSFILKHVADLGFGMPSMVEFGGKYQVDSDSLTDYGTIEFSPDNGTTWIDLIDQGQYDASIFWGDGQTDSEIPVLTGNSNGWKAFSVQLQQLGMVFSISTVDTVLFKFSFISDAIDNARDGLMFDSLYMWDVPPVGLDEQNSAGQLTIYPNPSDAYVTINPGTSDVEFRHLRICNLQGVLIEDRTISPAEGPIVINLDGYDEGIYLITLTDDNDSIRRSGRVVKRR